jgi:peptide/nickel transport system substrate-binding protein
MYTPGGRRPVVRVAIVLAVLAILSYGPLRNAGPSTASASSGGAGIFRIAFPSDVPTADPAHAGYDLESWSVAVSIYNGLMNYGRGPDLHPELAQSYALSNGGKRYVFHLRHGVLFQNGREFTANDVKYSFERVLDPKTKSEGSWLFEDIVQGAKAFQSGKAKHVSGFKVLNRYTFEIDLTQPQPFFIYKLAMPYAYIVPKEVVQKYGDNFSHHPVGTGAFELKSWVPGQSLTMVRNPHYFKPGKPKLKEVDYVIGPDDSKAMLMFLRGQLEVNDIPSQYFVSTITSPKWKPNIVRSVDFDTYFIGMKNNMKPFNDIRVRRALNYAVDVPHIIKLLNGRAVKANGVLPPGMPGYDAKIKGYNYNPAKAKQLLKAAGYAHGFHSSIWSYNDETSIRVVQAIQQNLAQVGVTVSTRPVSTATFAAQYAKKGQVPMFLFLWINDYPDPQDFLYNLFSKETWGTNNSVYYYDAPVQKLLDRAQTELNRSTRFGMYHVAEQKIVNDAPWIFLYHTITYNVHQPWVHNYYLHPIHLWRYEDYSVSAH